MTESAVPPEIEAAARVLVSRSGHGELISITAMAGGRNNRVYRLETTAKPAILKQYFRSPTDGRDRFASEFCFYRYCEIQGTIRVPTMKGFAADPPCILFEEIPGRKLCPGEVTADHVSQAIEFLQVLNADRDEALEIGLPLAADACFSLDDHLKTVEARLARLAAVEAGGDATQALHSWLKSELLPLWTDVRQRIERNHSPAKLRALLRASQRCVSPSDFGFHNAMVDEVGCVRFFDFEYAGWDDPAKTVCDFFWQVDVPAPRETMPMFVEGIQSFAGEIAPRVQTLFPAFGIKWCTIVLNEFLNHKRTQRKFAGGSETTEGVLVRQLHVAQRLLNDVRGQL